MNLNEECLLEFLTHSPEKMMTKKVATCTFDENRTESSKRDDKEGLQHTTKPVVFTKK